ncbi:hypothetical protein HZC07_00905 [Candidatus Micrarchaeota archaeon]|nr:hypothetical protein [Candidatus Micrarchaeota archaeon]
MNLLNASAGSGPVSKGAKPKLPLPLVNGLGATGEFNLHSGWAGREAQIKRTLERAFSTPATKMTLATGYFDRDPDSLLIHETGLAVAVMRMLSDGSLSVPYLDKIGADPLAKGKGYGAEMMAVLAALYPNGFMWRANPTKLALCEWYAQNKRSDGHTALDGWVVYWKGVSAGTIVHFNPIIAALPPTLIPTVSVLHSASAASINGTVPLIGVSHAA